MVAIDLRRRRMRMKRMTEMMMIVTLSAVEVCCICYLRIRVFLRVNVAAYLLHPPGEHPEFLQQQQQQQQQSALSSVPSATSE